MKTGLFVTCLVDFFRPQIAYACIELLKQARCKVVVPPQQTCCGQPAYNQGDLDHTRKIASQVIGLFSDCEAVVVPSGSCAGMLTRHYPALFPANSVLAHQAKQLAEKNMGTHRFPR